MSDTPTTALVPNSSSRSRSFSLLPNTFGEAREMAEMIANSEFAPKDYKGKPESVLIAIQMGADVGLSPMQALQNIAVINGRPSIWGDAALALVMPVLQRFKEWSEGTPGQDDYVAHCLAHRVGWPDETVRKFSVWDARKANLWGKAGPWTTYPGRMLQMRARSWALRDVGADRLMGFILAEEAMDMEPIQIGGGRTEAAALPAPPNAFESLPEPLRDKIEQAFAQIRLPEGLRVVKLNEFLHAPDTVPEEGAERLLEWCRDEFSKQKTGKPRAPKTDSNARTPRKSARGDTAPPAERGASGEATAPSEPPPANDAPPPTDEVTPPSGEVLFE